MVKSWVWCDVCVSALVWHSTHLVSGQPLQYHLCCVAADLSPQDVLLFMAALVRQQRPEGLGQLEGLQGWVTVRWDLRLWGTLRSLVLVMAAQPHEGPEQAFTHFACETTEIKVQSYAWGLLSPL